VSQEKYLSQFVGNPRCCRSSITMLTNVNTRGLFHFVKHFLPELRRILKAQPFSDNQRALSLHAGIDPSHLYRVEKGENIATPEFVGRLCATLPTETAAILLTAFLKDVLAATAAAKPNPKKKPLGTWRPPTSDLSIDIVCEMRKAS